MSTRSNIGIIEKDGRVRVVYCHSDGYLSYNGRLLRNYYTTEEQVKDLLDLGNLSALGKYPVSDSRHRSYNNNACIAYRDAGGDNQYSQDAIVYDSIEDYMNQLNKIVIEYVYLFNTSKHRWEWASYKDEYLNWRELTLEDIEEEK